MAGAAIKSFGLFLLNWLVILRIKRSNYNLNDCFNNILIVAPHPDDEILGLGGLLVKLADQKKKISIIYITDGENSAVWPDKDEIRKQRILMSEMVCRSLGIKSSAIFRFHIEDGNIPYEGHDGASDIIDSLEAVIDSIKPDAIFTTHPDDHWPYDHVAAAGLVREAVQHCADRPQLWFFWVWRWYNMRPRDLFKIRYNHLVKNRIVEQHQKKTELMNIYLNTLTAEGKPWSGILPGSLLKAFCRPFEILEKV
jgi:LmbE family N-acetylglucosaminyl deacetylase